MGDRLDLQAASDLMFRLLALALLAIVVVATLGSLWWVIPVLIIAAIVEWNSRTITIKFRVDD